MTEAQPTVVVVGAGFSGAVVAMHCLTAPAAGGRSPARITILNRSGPMARGVAYGTRSVSHVLNVPAGRMSAIASDEESFLRFARERDPSVTGGSFVARSLYGEYLEHILERAALDAAWGRTLDRLVAEAADILPDEHGAGARVVLTDGRVLRADRVVLALGNYPPADPAVPDPSFYADARYVRDPWMPHALAAIPREASVLLIGTGLTMLDVALELRARGARGALHAVSRRGLVPQSHRSPSVPPAHDHRPPDMEGGEKTAHAYLRSVRRHVRALAARGIDWREVIGSLRPITPALWQALDTRERARFLRHARPYWEVHRHRCAPELGIALREMMSTGVLTVHAARLCALAPGDDGVTVTMRPRGVATPTHLHVQRVVNCTGPAGDTRTLRDPLFTALRVRGLLRPDTHGLGIDVDERGAVLDARGRASTVIYHVGPFLRARYWEATAVPELRVHAERVARVVLDSLPAR